MIGELASLIRCRALEEKRMNENQDDKLLTSVEMQGGRYHLYKFYDHDEQSVKLVQSDEHPERYVIIQKQALLALANRVKSLADRFTK